MNIIKSVINSYSKEELMKNYNEAILNEEFKSFVIKIKLSDDIKQKYTSSLEESFNEYSNCLKCKSILKCRNKIEGCAYLPKVVNNRLHFQYKTCRYQNNLLKEEDYKKNINLFEVSKNLKNASMKDIITKDAKRFETIKWIKNFITNYEKDKNLKGLYLHGNFGCGKSYLLSAMFNEFAKKDIKSTIIFYPEFLRNLKESFDTDFDKKMYTVIHSPLLLIDDIGAENLTAWSRDEILSTILQYRMDNCLPTFFTSNLNLNELESHLSYTKNKEDIVKARRIIERIKQLTEQIEMISVNLRN